MPGRGTASAEALRWPWPGMLREERGVEGAGGDWRGAGGHGRKLSLEGRESGMQDFFSQDID